MVLNSEIAKVITACHKSGMRVYPVPEYKWYYLEIEINKSSRFEPKDKVGKPKRGKIRYKNNTNEWVTKMYELYQAYYEKNLQKEIEYNESFKNV